MIARLVTREVFVPFAVARLVIRRAVSGLAARTLSVKVPLAWRANDAIVQQATPPLIVACGAEFQRQPEG